MELLLLLGLGSAVMLSALFSSDDDTAEDTTDDAPQDPETPEDETVILDGGGSFTTGDGDDVILSSLPLDGAVTINSGAGDDTINVEQDDPSRSLVNAGDGNDVVRFEGGYADVNGEGGDDTLEALDDARSLNGGDGNDHLIAHGESQNMYGGEGNDTITADNIRSGEYLGEEGDDTFELVFDDLDYRHDIDETIHGGAGDDVFRITNVSHQDSPVIDEDGIPDTYTFGVQGGEGADTFEVIHEIDIGALSSEDEDFYMTNSTWIRDFDPEEDVLVITPEDTGVFSGAPTLTIHSGTPGTSGTVTNNIDVAYTNDATGVTATWRLHVTATRTLTEDDIVLNLAA